MTFLFHFANFHDLKKPSFCTQLQTPSSCKSGVVDSNLQCCPSGLIDTAGTCCPTDAKLDGKGKCCSLGVDACGVCGGTGKFVDMQNKCCTVGDANGMCCLVCLF